MFRTHTTHNTQHTPKHSKPQCSRPLPSRIDLLELLKHPEGTMLMFKHELSQPDGALQTITGCANIAGDSHLSGLHSHSKSTMPLIAPTGDPDESRQPPARHPAFSQEHNFQPRAQQPDCNTSRNYCRHKSSQLARCGCDAHVQCGAIWGKAWS